MVRMLRVWRLLPPRKWIGADSTTRTARPRLRAVMAAQSAALPPPITSRSYRREKSTSRPGIPYRIPEHTCAKLGLCGPIACRMPDATRALMTETREDPNEIFDANDARSGGNGRRRSCRRADLPQPPRHIDRRICPRRRHGYRGPDNRAKARRKHRAIGRRREQSRRRRQHRRPAHRHGPARRLHDPPHLCRSDGCCAASHQGPCRTIPSATSRRSPWVWCSRT